MIPKVVKESILSITLLLNDSLYDSYLSEGY